MGRHARLGLVHGIFYPDGTIRDPSIPMAVMGIFRNRGPDVVLERPNRENRVARTIADARRWLANVNGDWQAGLDIAETAANLLESAQLVPLHDLPTRQVEVLRAGRRTGRPSRRSWTRTSPRSNLMDDERSRARENRSACDRPLRRPLGHRRKLQARPAGGRPTAFFQAASSTAPPWPRTRLARLRPAASPAVPRPVPDTLTD